MSILALTYLLLRFVHCSSFVRLLFVFCSFIVRSLFVHCSSFLRLLFVFSLSARAVRTVFCSSHFFVTTLPLLGRSLRIGEYVTGERIFCLSFIWLLFVQLPIVLRPRIIINLVLLALLAFLILLLFFHYFAENPFPSVLSYPFTFFRSK